MVSTLVAYEDQDYEDYEDQDGITEVAQESITEDRTRLEGQCQAWMFEWLALPWADAVCGQRMFSVPSVTKQRKHFLLGVYKVDPGYLLIGQSLHCIHLLKYRNAKRKAKNFSPKNLPKRKRISDVGKMGWLSSECRLDIGSPHG